MNVPVVLARIMEHAWMVRTGILVPVELVLQVHSVRPISTSACRILAKMVASVWIKTMDFCASASRHTQEIPAVQVRLLKICIY